MAGYAIDSDTAFGTTEGGALRKCPVDIYSERARRRGGRRERERISYDWVLTKTMPMRGAEPEMLRIHEYKKNKLKRMSKRRMGDSAEPDFRDNHYFKTTQKTRVSILDRCLS